MDIRGRRVLVTGGSGFLGQHLCHELSSVGEAHVIAPSRVAYDLRRRDDIDEMLHTWKPDAVIHLAAVVGGIGANRDNPGRFFYDNAVMGIEMLEACRVHKVGKVVIAGTVCAYPKFTQVPFSEDDLWSGYPEETNAPYGLAKRMLLVQAQAYRAQYGSNMIFVLPTNLYGEGDNFDLEAGHVIPAMIRKFTEAVEKGVDKVELWGDGSPSREFLYVGDAAVGFRMALEGYDDPEPVNLGSGREVTMAELALTIASLTGYDGLIVWDPSKPNGQPRRQLDTSRAALFGFTAQVSLEAGLRRTVEWYRRKEAHL